MLKLFGIRLITHICLKTFIYLQSHTHSHTPKQHPTSGIVKTGVFERYSTRHHTVYMLNRVREYMDMWRFEIKFSDDVRLY